MTNAFPSVRACPRASSPLGFMRTCFEGRSTDRTHPSFFRLPVAHIGALSRTEDGFAMDAFNRRPTGWATAPGLAGMTLASSFPMWYLSRNGSLKHFILGRSQQVERQRQLHLSGAYNSLVKSATLEPAFDFNVVGSIHQNIRAVHVLRAIRQNYEKSFWLVNKLALLICQIPQIVGFPTRAHIKVQIVPKSTNARRMIGLLSVGRSGQTDSRERETTSITVLAGFIALSAASIAGEYRKCASTMTANKSYRRLSAASLFQSCLALRSRAKSGTSSSTKPTLARRLKDIAAKLTRLGHVQTIAQCVFICNLMAKREVGTNGLHSTENFCCE